MCRENGHRHVLLPSLLVVGSMKAGTTQLWAQLVTHAKPYLTTGCCRIQSETRVPAKSQLVIQNQYFLQVARRKNVENDVNKNIKWHPR